MDRPTRVGRRERGATATAVTFALAIGLLSDRPLLTQPVMTDRPSPPHDA